MIKVALTLRGNLPGEKRTQDKLRIFLHFQNPLNHVLEKWQQLPLIQSCTFFPSNFFLFFFFFGLFICSVSSFLVSLHLCNQSWLTSLFVICKYSQTRCAWVALQGKSMRTAYQNLIFFNVHRVTCLLSCSISYFKIPCGD